MDTTSPQTTSAPTQAPPPQPQPPTQAQFYTFDNAMFLPNNICSFNNAYLVLIPVVVVCGIILNGFALEVLQSPFLSDLPSQPIIKAFLTLHSALLITGPLYLWMIHIFGPLLTVNEVFPCFFMSWFHDFLTMITSWLLVVWMLERTVTLGRLKDTWVFWRKRFLEVSIILVGLTLTVTFAGSVSNGRLSGIYRDPVFSMDVCLPWLDMERIMAFPTWPRVHAVLFSLAPCVMLFLVFISLVTSIYYLSYRLKQLFMGRSDYQVSLVLAKSATQLKFVHCLVWACPIFFLTCAPIGLAMFTLCSDLNVHGIFPLGDGKFQTFHSAWDGTHEGLRIDYGGISIENLTDEEKYGKNFSSNFGAPRASLEGFLGDWHLKGNQGKSMDTNINSTTATSGIESVIHDDNTLVQAVDDDDVVKEQRIKRRHRVSGRDTRSRLLRSVLGILKLTGNETTANRMNGSSGDDVGGGGSSPTSSSSPTMSDPVNTSSSNPWPQNVGDGISSVKQAKTKQYDDDNAGGDGHKDDKDHRDDNDKNDDDDDTGRHGDDAPPPMRGVDVACIMWLAYYGFSLVIVPLLLITEPVFRYEWYQTWRDLKKFCCYSCCFSSQDAQDMDVAIVIQGNVGMGTPNNQH